MPASINVYPTGPSEDAGNEKTSSAHPTDTPIYASLPFGWPTAIEVAGIGMQPLLWQSSASALPEWSALIVPAHISRNVMKC